MGIFSLFLCFRIRRWKLLSRTKELGDGNSCREQKSWRWKPSLGWNLEKMKSIGSGYRPNLPFFSCHPGSKNHGCVLPFLMDSIFLNWTLWMSHLMHRNSGTPPFMLSYFWNPDMFELLWIQFSCFTLQSRGVSLYLLTWHMPCILITWYGKSSILSMPVAILWFQSFHDMKSHLRTNMKKIINPSCMEGLSSNTMQINVMQRMLSLLSYSGK